MLFSNQTVHFLHPLNKQQCDFNPHDYNCDIEYEFNIL